MSLALLAAGYASALLVGAVLGVLGAGGATITVPIFVYLFGIPPKVATVLSLGVVGGVGLLGVVRAYPRREVDWVWAARVAVPSMAAVWVTRRWLVPLIPEGADFALMLAFAALVLVVARSMLGSSKGAGGPGVTLAPARFMARASGVGVVTGLLGAGGGFLIVPMLTEWARLPFRTAASTSLLVILANSAMGLYSGWSSALDPWMSEWVIFCGLAGAGLWAGGRLASRISAESLKRGFAYFLIAVATVTMLTELLGLMTG